ncbi:hypothetical protein [Paraburkholderia acidicola]|nr:hypothetical protein [Paraburkholderia acidicola]
MHPSSVPTRHTGSSTNQRSTRARKLIAALLAPALFTASAWAGTIPVTALSPIQPASTGTGITSESIQATIEASKVDLNAMPRARWLALIDLVRGAPQRLSIEMNGDHFFFIGAAGARETARAIQTLDDRVAGFKSQLQDLVPELINR